jgi:hypothetical protein
VAGHFVATLKELGVAQEIIDEVSVRGRGEKEWCRRDSVTAGVMR